MTSHSEKNCNFSQVSKKESFKKNVSFANYTSLLPQRWHWGRLGGHYESLKGEPRFKGLAIHQGVMLILVSLCPPVHVADPGTEVPTATSALEMALYSNTRKLRQGCRSLETAVPT